MLLSSQITVLRQWIVDAIAACPGLEAIPLERVVWSDEDFPDPVYPYALLGYTGSVGVGISPAQSVDDDDKLKTRTGSNTTVSITIVAKPSDTAPTLDQRADSYIRELRLRLKSFVAEPLRLADMAVRAEAVTPNVDRLQGRSQWESRSVLDVTFGHAAVITEDPGVIETAFVSGATTPATAPTAPQQIPG